MNKNVSIMITLQKNWDTIQETQRQIARNTHTAAFWENELCEFRAEISKMKIIILDFKKSIKEYELLLAESDGKIKKLEERRVHLKNEKEILAAGREIDQLKNERGAVEEKLIALFDRLDESEKKEEEMLGGENEKEKQVSHDVEELKKKNDELERVIRLHREQFEGVINDVDAVYQSRFLKLLNSKDNKAIGAVKGEICENCNFTIPPSLAIDSGRDEKVMSCTNCGRFIYKI